MYRIFIVEDDRALAAAMEKQISSWGHQVRCARDFRNVMEEFLAFDPHLVLLDIGLPFYNGYHWCEATRCRKRSRPERAAHSYFLGILGYISSSKASAGGDFPSTFSLV